jgi:hypothetical protein
MEQDEDKIICYTESLKDEKRTDPTKTVWLGIRKMCQREQHVYPRTVFSVSYLYKDPSQCVALVQSGLPHHFIANNFCLDALFLPQFSQYNVE